MVQDILIIGVLFPAIPLMMINFGNRYTVLAALIRNLHDQVIGEQTPPADRVRFLRQINSLRRRLRLIGIVQSCGAFAFVCTLGAMLAAYGDEMIWASTLFVAALVLMTLAMALFAIEVQIANRALDVHLSDLEEVQEWQQVRRQRRP